MNNQIHKQNRSVSPRRSKLLIGIIIGITLAVIITPSRVSAISATGWTVNGQNTNFDGDTNTGKVGIGTTSPLGRLSVGPLNQVYVSIDYPNTINSGGSINGYADLWLNHMGYNNGATQARDLRIGNGKGGDGMARFDGTNNRIGMFTTTPRSTVDIKGETVVDGRLTITQNSTTSGKSYHMDNSVGSFRLFEQSNMNAGSGKVRMYINDAGDMCLGNC